MSEIDIEEGDYSVVEVPKSVADEFAEMMGEIGGDATLSVYAQPGNGQQQMVFCFKRPVTDFADTEDLFVEIQKQYPKGGEFRVHLREGKRMVKNQLFTIAPSNKPVTDALPVAHGGGEVGEMMREVLTYLRESKEKPQSRTEILEELKMMSSIIGTGGAPVQQVNPMQMTLETLKMMQELKKFTGDGGGDGDSLTGVIGQSLPELLGIIKESSKSPNPQPQAAPNVGGEKTANPSPRKISENKDDMNVMSMINKLLNNVVAWAKAGRDPALRAEVLAEELADLPENLYVGFIGLLRKDDFIAKASMINPSVKEYADWVNELRDNVLAMHDEAEKEALADSDLTDGNGKANNGGDVPDS